jgi:AraC-like DNA-binding protein
LNSAAEIRSADALMRAGSVPLQGHVLFESADRDETRERVAQVFCPHELRVLPGEGRLAARQHLVPFGRASISYLAYGVPVGIDPELFRTFYLVQVPLCGSARIRIGDHEFASSSRVASMINPSDPLRMEWSRDCGQLIVRFERGLVESLVANYLGHTLRRALSFRNELDCRAERSGRWLQLVHYVVSQVESAPTCAFGSLAARQLEQSLLALLLETQPHNYSEQLSPPAGGCAPRHVRRAAEFIEANVAEPIGIEEIVHASGASMRSLYEGFRRFRGTSPMEFLRTMRLRRVHEDLIDAPAGATVSDVATRWGFYQFGRFAAQYRQLFGETPSATLRRASSSRD